LLSPADVVAWNFWNGYAAHRETGILAIEWERMTNGAEDWQKVLFAQRLAMCESAARAIAREEAREKAKSESKTRDTDTGKR
jgi:hypothetical protein